MSNRGKFVLGCAALLAMYVVYLFLGPDHECTSGSCSFSVATTDTIKVHRGGKNSSSSTTTVEVERIDPAGVGLRRGSERVRLAVGESKKFAGTTFRLAAMSGNRATIEIHHNLN